MKKFTYFLLAFAVFITVSSCKKEKSGPAPTVDFSFSGGSFAAPSTVQFTNLSTDATSYEWDFGDGTKSTETNPSHVFTTAGTYSVVLKGTNSSGTNQANKTIIIGSVPTADFSFTGGSCRAPCSLQFNNQSSGATSYSWDFGDGNFSTETNPSHLYSSGGSYSVTLRATNSYGSKSINKVITIANAPTTVKITKVEIINLPFTNSSGSGWDQTTGPDLFFKITNQSSSVLVDGTLARFMDVAPSQLPVGWTFNPAFEIADLSAARFIYVWDYDFPDVDDEIGYVGFLMTNYTSGPNQYPTTVTETQNGITVKLTLTWQ
jgi:PKD repeat protein